MNATIPAFEQIGIQALIAGMEEYRKYASFFTHEILVLTGVVRDDGQHEFSWRAIKALNGTATPGRVAVLAKVGDLGRPWRGRSSYNKSLSEFHPTRKNRKMSR